jgi:ADP-ribose pyrophosphatase
VLENDGDLEIVAGHQCGGGGLTAFTLPCQHFLVDFTPMAKLETLFETRWIQLQRIGHWDFVRRPHSDSCVGILAITPEQEIVLVEQFRIPVQRRVIEIPAGIVGDEDEHRGEPLEATAARELLEETGYRAGTIERLMETPTSAGLTAEFVHLFHAKELVREQSGGGVAGEDITVHHVPLANLREWLREKETAGVLVDYKICACLWLARIFV